MPDSKIRKLWDEVVKTLAVISRELKTPVYIVGGTVRRLLQGLPVNDLDLVADAAGGAEAVAKALSGRMQEASEPAKINAFSTVEVRVGGLVVQISETGETKDGEADTVYAPISARMKADALRRDFTVNTLLLPVDNPAPGAVIDPLGIGVKDLHRGVLRTPVEPERTFGADPLRILRAVRFVAIDDFFISEELRPAIRRMAERIADLPGERINAELSRILTSDRPAYGIRLLMRYGLLKYVLPDIERLAAVDQPADYYGDDALSHSLKVLDGAPPMLRLRLAALFHDVGKAHTRVEKDGAVVFQGHQYVSAERTGEALRRLRYPNRLIEEVTRLVEMHMVAYREEWSDTAVRRLVREAGDLLDDLLLLYRADILARLSPHNNLSAFEHLMTRIKSLDLERIINARSPLSGEEVMEILGVAEGPVIGEAQSAIERAIVDGRIDSTPEAARNYLAREAASRLGGKTQ